jgi:hypothetical protein
VHCPWTTTRRLRVWVCWQSLQVEYTGSFLIFNRACLLASVCPTRGIPDFGPAIITMVWFKKWIIENPSRTVPLFGYLQSGINNLLLNFVSMLSRLQSLTMVWGLPLLCKSQLRFLSLMFSFKVVSKVSFLCWNLWTFLSHRPRFQMLPLQNKQVYEMFNKSLAGTENWILTPLWAPNHHFSWWNHSRVDSVGEGSYIYTVIFESPCTKKAYCSVKIKSHIIY